MKWFRMYHEARTDGKLDFLSDTQFRVWFRLMCYASEQTLRGFIPTRNKRLMAVEIAHGDVVLFEETISILSELEIVQVRDDGISIVNWDKRQFDSDHSTNRWRKWKDQQETNVGQTLDKRSSNDVPTENKQKTTPPDPDLDKELKDHVQPDGYTPEFESFWSEYPRRKEKKSAFSEWNKRLKQKASPEDMILAAINYANECRQQNREQTFIKHAKTFIGSSRPYEDYLNTQVPEEHQDQVEKTVYATTTEEEAKELMKIYEFTFNRQS